MPYNTRYLMQQMARGRPAPTGSPEQDLLSAIERLSFMDIDKAFQVGASPGARLKGRNAFHALLDTCLIPQTNAIRAHPLRILECVRALVRAQVRLDEVDPKLNESAAARLAWIATAPMGGELIRLLGPRMMWNAPIGPRGPTVIEAWRERAAPEIQALLPQPNSPRPRVR